MRLLAGITATIALLVAASVIVPLGASARRQPQRPPPTTQKKPTPPPTTSPTTQEVGDGDVVHVDTELVTLTATVTDARGRYVANLK